MCGRFTQLFSWPEILAFYRIVGDICPDLAASWNVAPTQGAAVLAAGGDGGVALTRMIFGLIPSWAKDPAIGAKLINARAETIGEKAAFRHALRARRCVLPVSGFYEWGRMTVREPERAVASDGSPSAAALARLSARPSRDAGRQPYYITSADGAPLSLAGLWERWNDRLTFTIITVPANEVIAAIHERMPAILAPEDARAWIESGDVALLKPCEPERLSLRPVSRRVNAPGNNDAGLIEAVSEETSPPEPQTQPRNDGEKPSEASQFSFSF